MYRTVIRARFFLELIESICYSESVPALLQIVFQIKLAVPWSHLNHLSLKQPLRGKDAFKCLQGLSSKWLRAW